MIDDDDMRARTLAAETWLYLERSCPGGTKTVAWRLLPHRRKAFAEKMAKELPADAAPSDRKAFMFEADDRGDPDIRPTDAVTNVKIMTADERLDHANRIAGLGRYKPLTAQELLALASKTAVKKDEDND